MADDPRKLSREELKQELLKNTVASERAAGTLQFLDRQRTREREKARDILTIFTLLLAFAAGVMFYMHNYSYTTYTVDFTSSMGAGHSSKVYSYKDGNIVIGSDSVTYIKESSTIFTTSLEVKDPILTFSKNYFALGSKGGYQFYILDETGLISTVKVSRKIIGLGISTEGITAVFTESSDASYVSYFDRYGNRLPIEVKAVMSASGYPVHISVSPDGNKLIVLYYSLANGAGESRMVFYDFAKGKESANYVIGTIEDYYSRGTFAIDSEFLDDSHAVVVGDNSITFLTYEESKRSLTSSFTDLPENTQSVFFTDSYMGVLASGDEEGTAYIYQNNGLLHAQFPISGSFSIAAATDRYLALLFGTEINMYNMSGKHRYTGQLVEAPVSAAFSRNNTLMINTGALLEKITLK